ncbi:hypothetical protein [Sphingomonas sp. M1-B02]|uniref:hypothetical protein n=1 Tax=Sphingomonas sp. M1-B02 TaxID=3114300 RepID=UPI00223F0B93|nr:hypothetical protein [Sphingomonas sp. S6-11]UZK67785.1 hypothetical protein OKW87_08140 [Sphingomonas sp. S6-11]
MTTDNTILCTHVAAAVQMLLGKNVRMEPGVAVTGGDSLAAEGKTGLIRAAVAFDTDVIHLAFETMRDGLVLAGIEVFVPRDGACYSYSACRLWLAEGSARAVILPRDGVRGHFALHPGELIHVDGKPKGLVAEGFRRADQRLRALVRTQPGFGNGLDIDDVPQAA